MTAGRPLQRPLRRSRRAHVSLSVDEQGLQVSAPRGMALPQIEQAIREGSRANVTIIHATEEVKGRGIPEWLSLEGEMGGKVVSMPTREQINLPVQEQLIVELYSK